MRTQFETIPIGRAASLLGALLLLAGCSGMQEPQATAPAAPPMVWPAAPETARIAYVGSIVRPADLGVKRSSLSRFGRWLTGSEKGNEALVRPFGIALDEQDNLCLTDTGSNTVSYYDKVRKKWTRWNKIGQIRFSSPVAIAKRNGVFYVADSGRGSILAFDENEKVIFESRSHLERPSGLTLLGDRLFIADSQRHKIVSFDLQGNHLSEFGRRGKADGEFNFPTHLAADAEGNLYVTDSMNSRVQILDAQGGYKGQLGSVGDSPGHFGRPKGVSVDSLGHIYAIDAIFDNLQIFDRSGRLLLNLGGSGSGPGEFWLPNGLAISRQNEIYATDSYNHRIQVFKYIGPL